MSNEEFDRTIPVSPPRVKRKMKPRVHSIAGVKATLDPWSVASHLNTLIPVGTAIIIVADVK